MCDVPPPPKLPPIVKGARDEYSGARDILKALGLRPAYDHFLAAGPPTAVLNCDTELHGISSGFGLRQGRAMELAPLVEAHVAPGVPKELKPLDREVARAAFGGFSATTFSLRKEDLGVVPAIVRRAKAEAEARGTLTSGASASNVAEPFVPQPGEKRKRDKKDKGEKKEKKEKKESKRRRRGADATPTQSGLSGPTDSGVTSG